MSFLLIRADGNAKIGSGHIMRCLSVAQALKEKNIKCVFVTADNEMRGRIEQNGFENVCLESNYCDMEKELPVMLEFIEKNKPAGILLDSYYITSLYMSALHDMVTLAYMDDLNSFLYPADMVINYNLFSSKQEYDKIYKSTNTQLVLGSSFTPLREEFKGLPERKPINGIKNILISTGGADYMGIGLAVLQYAIQKPKYEWHFIIGALSEQVEKMRDIAGQYKHIHLHFNVTQMAKLMCSCDFAVSAGGSTLYELCAAGTPAACYTFADNQTAATEIFARKGIMISLGDYREECKNSGDEFLKKIDNAVSYYDSNPKKWLIASKKMQTVADGYGAQRLAEKIITCMNL